MSNRILDYPEATEITSDDYILLDNEGTGAKCIKASALNINMDNYTIKEASGAIASFDDGEDLPLAFMGAYITAIQDLHGYDYPWVGGSGKNKFDISTYVSGSSNFTKSGETFSNSITDTKTNFEINAFSVDNNDNLTSIASDVINSTGQKVYSFSISSESKIWIKHNGATQDLWLRFSQKLPTGSYKLIFNVDAYNPSTTNGLKISNIMVVASTETNYTFAPYSNECPIIGWSGVDVTRCGIQQWDEEWEVGDIDAQGNPTSSTTLIRTKNFNPCKPNTTYSVVIPSGKSMYVKYYDKDKNFITPTVSASSTITTPSNCYYFKFVMGSSYGTTYNNDISINYPSTDTSYHAYNGNTYSLTFTDGTNPLTVYGGTVDLVSGVLTVDRVYVDMGSPTWSYTNGRFYYNPTNAKVYTQLEVANLLCSQYPKSQYSSQADNSISSYAGYIYVRADSYSGNTTAFKTAMNGVQLVYELATPLTYQLSKQQIRSLVGENNIFADTGDSIVDYRKLWIKPEM